ncbi:multidrug and toxin extrusion protein 1 [Electrophorus electricus]|uniref:multidrug and toxin extrusion protein 1 n=1 Tax=Electrophorus electricus TaxID=8005 RepID=UPI0015CFEC56|nr:multidrug and toxin extrusion protein 1 [Electrophorus electricus]
MDKARIPEAAESLAGSGQVTEATAPSSRLFRCGFVQRWVPLAYREELYQVLHLTGPLLISRILSFLQPFVNTIFVGQLGNAELAGYALASATLSVTTIATGYGLALACDTLVSQTFGSKKLKRVGEILQRSVLILLLFCLPCWALLINAESILLAMQQQAEVARIAQVYVLAFLPAVPATFLHQLQVSYLQNQGIILPQMYTAAAANILNVVVNYVLIFWMEQGVMGSAVACSIANISICLLLFGYIRWKKLHVKTWGGWSIASLQEWDTFMQLAIPSTLMLCFEWWIYEIGGFLAGMLGEVDLAAQHVLLELSAIIYMFPLGVHAAACVRVGNALGAGDTARALITSKVTLTVSGILALLQGIVLGFTKSVLGFIFTSDVTIVNIVSENMTFYIFLQFFDALVCVSSGILLGSGKQKIAAISNLICYYCIGLPLGISLMFAADLRILGLTLGLLVCVVIQACFFITLIFKLNWKKVTQQAQKRAGKTTKATCVVQKVPACTPVIDTLLLEEQDSVEQIIYGGTVAQLMNVGSKLAVVEDGEPGEGRPKSLLSVPQLVLRRGLTLLAALLVLAAGVVVHLTCPLPEPFHQIKSNLTMEWWNYTTPAPFPKSRAS